MSMENKHLLLADDDDDDCLLFRDALRELPFATLLSVVSDGAELMKVLTDTSIPLPDFLFLDLNMPRKNGTECLLEIKQDKRLKDLPVIIFSTCALQPTINNLFAMGAQHYIRKPASFQDLTVLIEQALSGFSGSGNVPPSKDAFILSMH